MLQFKRNTEQEYGYTLDLAQFLSYEIPHGPRVCDGRKVNHSQ